MAHVVATRGAVGLLSDDLVGFRLPDAVPPQFDPKTPQANVIEHDRLGYHAYSPFRHVDLQLFELVGQRLQVCHDLRRCGKRRDSGPGRQSRFESFELADELASAVVQVVNQRLAGCLPLARLDMLPSGVDLANAVPQKLREFVDRCPPRAMQIFVDFEGGANRVPPLLIQFGHWRFSEVN